MWCELFVIAEERDQRQIDSNLIAVLDAQGQRFQIVFFRDAKLQRGDGSCPIHSNDCRFARLNLQIERARGVERVEITCWRGHVPREPRHFIHRQPAKRFDARLIRQTHAGREKPFRLFGAAIRQHAQMFLIRNRDDASVRAEFAMPPRENLRKFRRQSQRFAGKPIHNRAIVRDALVHLDPQISQFVEIAPLDQLIHTANRSNVTPRFFRLQHPCGILREPEFVHHARTLAINNQVAGECLPR